MLKYNNFLSVILFGLLGVSFLIRRDDVSLLFVNGKEMEVTKEWQLVGENDTVPAGVHVRMDLEKGQKWVKLIDDDDDDKEEDKISTTTTSTNDASGVVSMAVVQEDGSVKISDDDKKKEENKGYDFDLMYRTLSKLPDDEKERIGGLPELPQAKEGSVKLTSKERKAFEERMLKIWKKRQEELAELQEMLMDFPEILRERIKSIDEYLKNPQDHLNDLDLDAEVPEGIVTHIVSILDDLEFQLSDVDMARDFHTMGGWPLLSLLISEDSHLPLNKTISTLSKETEAKIRAIQARAAWTAGTAVSNTEEFYPYAIEKVVVGDGKISTIVDLLIDTFLKQYR